jgi:hypothetical protein
VEVAVEQPRAPGSGGQQAPDRQGSIHGNLVQGGSRIHPPLAWKPGGPTNRQARQIAPERIGRQSGLHSMLLERGDLFRDADVAPIVGKVRCGSDGQDLKAIER